MINELQRRKRATRKNYKKMTYSCLGTNVLSEERYLQSKLGNIITKDQPFQVLFIKTIMSADSSHCSCYGNAAELPSPERESVKNINSPLGDPHKSMVDQKDHVTSVSKDMESSQTKNKSARYLHFLPLG